MHFMYCLKVPKDVSYEEAGLRLSSMSATPRECIETISGPEYWPMLERSGWKVVKVKIEEVE